jgi:general secretion pathway protein F
MKISLWVANTSGTPVLREFEAVSRDAAVQSAKADGLAVMSFGPAQTIRAKSRGSMGRFSVHLFTEELVALLGAGLNLLEGLRALVGKADGVGKRVLQSILEDLSTGKRFSEALEAHPEFPSIYISLVRASEQTSDLPTSLQRYLIHSAQMDDARQKAISAAIYPALLIVVGSSALVFLLLYVVPRFSGIYEGMRGELPWSAKLMMHWSLVVRDHGSELFLTLVCLVFVLVAVFTNSRTRLAMIDALHQLPYLGEQLRLFHMARLFRTVGMLLEGGIPLVSAMGMAINVLPVDLRRRAQAALDRIREGVRPSQALREVGISSSIADQMLVVGERSGELGAMMSRIAAFYEADTTRKLTRAMSVFEPILMAFIGLGIGVIVILMYLPIFELAGSIR